jgi:hypothetical protein
MTIKTTISSQRDPVGAAREISEAFAGLKPTLLVFFATSKLEGDALCRELGKAFAGVPSIGCTTSGELAQGRMLKDSVVAAAFEADVISQARVALVLDMASEPQLRQALDEVLPGGDPLDPSTHVGLILHDGLSLHEENVMATLSALSNIAFVGGSAGDDLAFHTTRVFANFEAVSGASALAVIKPARGYRILKTQSFDVLDEVLTVTDADEATRTVHTFNGRPAAEEYARAIGVPVTKLASRFFTNPLGLVTASGEPYVRSPMRVQEKSVVFYCQIKKGMQLSLLQARDIVADTARDLDLAVQGMQSISGLLNFHCILRTLELEERGQTEAYGNLFTQMPMLGFSTYGESYIGHINQTSTMVLFE